MLEATGALPWIFLALGAAVLGTLVFLVVRIVLSMQKVQQQTAQPVQTCRAVVEETEQQLRARRKLSVSTVEFEQEAQWIAVFRLENGSCLPLSIPEDVYDWLEQGQTGILTYQGTRFLEFQPQGDTLL